MDTPEITTKTKWAIDPDHSEIGFRVKHLLAANVRGRFKEYRTQIYTSGNDFRTAEIEVYINAASIETGTGKRDEHLRSADFFDVEQFTTISFTGGTLVAADGESRLALIGDLTMKGTKKKIKLDVDFGSTIKDPWGAEKALFSISGKINRKNWGLNYNAVLEAGGVLVGEDVWIECEIQLIKQAQ